MDECEHDLVDGVVFLLELEDVVFELAWVDEEALVVFLEEFVNAVFFLQVNKELKQVGLDKREHVFKINLGLLETSLDWGKLRVHESHLLGLVLLDLTCIFGVQNVQKLHELLLALLDLICDLFSYTKVLISQSVLNNLGNKYRGSPHKLVPCKFRASLLELFEHQNNFSRIDIGLLEIVDHLVIVEELDERYPTCIDIQLLKLILEVTTLVDFRQENVLGLLDAAS
jgi:hypothetical protein